MSEQSGSSRYGTVAVERPLSSMISLYLLRRTPVQRCGRHEIEIVASPYYTLPFKESIARVICVAPGRESVCVVTDFGRNPHLTLFALSIVMTSIITMRPHPGRALDHIGIFRPDRDIYVTLKQTILSKLSV